MAGKFEGTLDELKALLEQAGFSGRWSDDGRGKHSFRSSENGVLNWWPNTGSLNFQGKAESKTKLEAQFEDSVSETRVSEQDEISGFKRISSLSMATTRMHWTNSNLRCTAWDSNRSF